MSSAEGLRRGDRTGGVLAQRAQRGRWEVYPLRGLIGSATPPGWIEGGGGVGSPRTPMAYGVNVSETLSEGSGGREWTRKFASLPH